MGRDLTPEELKEFEERRREDDQHIAKIFGITVEELRTRRKKASDEVHADDSWEKELNERNKRKAGIL
ncbi:MAG: hypothetical protein ACI4II_04950 [Acutalibacteraceae bacterium]